MSKAKKNERGEVIPENKWWCETCKSPEMTFDEMKAHLTTAHGCDVAKTKCRKQMVMHMDGDTWYSYQWDVTAETPTGEIKLTNSTVSPRAEDDMMRYA